ncbi:3-dehydroquinate synthase [Rhodothalassium salexigens]|uniref:3-dehydroquinate synthase n=1 Tax=Rhodothalassium salexigens TaxID=1086 RepID=UPI0019134D43|nr:3-dehydroquinate synthase [Rhodothalassium salexigens]MBK5921936.1 3-dehydroquinate synthase [Rhodothalassium salexigens]
MSFQSTLTVDLGPRSYEIRIGAGLLASLGDQIAPVIARPRVALVTDRHVYDAHGPEALAALEAAGIASTSVILTPGEVSKGWDGLSALCERLLEAGVERQDTIVALGGGVVGDLAGFAAAILRRGVDFIQVPTTLLAQVDSSVGGKTGINTRQGKNLIGAFHQPRMVLADLDVLGSLPRRELLAGYAEVVKMGLINQPKFFEWLEREGVALTTRDHKLMGTAVETCCRAKAGIVAEDEREQGRRALLNLGHTFAHAFEACAGMKGDLLHGEAVAAGMVLAFELSERLGVCEAGRAERVARHLASVKLPTSPADLPIKGDADKIVDAMAQDKKAVDGRLRFILARDIGAAYVAEDVDPVAVRDLLAEHLSRRGGRSGARSKPPVSA